MKTPPPNFDYEIALRNYILGSLFGFLAKHYLQLNNLSDETAFLLGATLIGMYDFVAYRVKRWLKSLKEKNENEP